MGTRILALAALVLVACSRSNAPSTKPAHVVLISIDTLRADALGAYGEKRPTSPTFDALARESIVFDRAMSQAGVTAPSHMALFTSLYPSVHRVANTFSEADAKALGVDYTKIFRTRLDPKATTMAQVFAKAGYRTAAFTGGGNVNREVGFDQGFELFDDSPDNGMSGIEGEPFDFSRAAKWIDEHTSERFFLFLHTYIPHSPYLPPAPWNTAFDPDYKGQMMSDRASLIALGLGNRIDRVNAFWHRMQRGDARDLEHLKALYFGGVRTADDALATMIAKLKQDGVWDDSIVVVLSDHGEEFLEHGELEHSGELWNELVHVPLLVHLPSKPSARIETPVRLIDVLPTLCELADLPVPAQAQGVSLAPCIAGKTEERPVVSEMVTSWRTPENGPVTPNEFLRTLRIGSWMFLVLTGNDQRVEELYDLAADPGEKKNLIADPSKRELIEHLRKLVANHDDACRQLAASLTGATQVELSNKTIDDLKSLGYLK